MHQSVKKELEALELEAAGLAESSDDESMQPEIEPANSTEAQLKGDDSEERPVGIGIRAPPPDLDGRVIPIIECRIPDLVKI